MKKLVITSCLVTSLMLASPVVSKAELGDQTLRSGMTNNDVKQLQEVLKKKGYFTDKKMNTYFGTTTKNAVIKFQKSKGLKADGVVGTNTYKALGITKKSTEKSVVTDAKKYLNVPYVWGGTTPKGFDCSGFLRYVFKESSSVTLPRTVAEIYKKGVKVSSPKAGDLVFFKTYQSGASHAGIYLGNNQFIHSSSSKGVNISSIKSSYWSQRYLGAKRIN